MKTLIIDELKSNFLRFFKKEYDYATLMKRSYDEGFPIIFSVLLMNILFIALALTTDIVDIYLDIPYWWSLLVKLPIVLFSIINFKIWNNKKLFIIDLIFICLSIFIPYYTIFALFYMLIKTCIRFAFIQNSGN